MTKIFYMKLLYMFAFLFDWFLYSQKIKCSYTGQQNHTWVSANSTVKPKVLILASAISHHNIHTGSLQGSHLLSFWSYKDFLYQNYQGWCRGDFWILSSSWKVCSILHYLTFFRCLSGQIQIIWCGRSNDTEHLEDVIQLIRETSWRNWWSIMRSWLCKYS